MPLSKIQDIGNQVIPNLGPRNAIINGAMQVSQRSTSEAALGNGSSDIVRTVDRIKFSHDSTTGRITMSQNSPTDLPGFTKSVKLQVTTALASPAAGNYIQLKYGFEGQQLQHFAKGTSTAKVMALSFYVKGNGNATYMCELEDHDNGRNNQQQFSVTSSWNRVQLLYAGDTTGAFGNDANLSMSVLFWLVAGSTYSGGSYTANTWASPTTNKRAAGISNLYSSTSNFIEITGLQLEPIQVTEFEHEPISITLEKCQRYFQKNDCGAFVMQIVRDSDDIKRGTLFFPTRTRSNSPSVTLTTTTLDGATLAIDEARDTAASITMSSGSDGNVPRIHVYTVEDEL